MLQETFCYGDVLYGDVLSRRRFVWRRFVCAPNQLPLGPDEHHKIFLNSVSNSWS
jgi:hypothetical protein